MKQLQLVWWKYIFAIHHVYIPSTIFFAATSPPIISMLLATLSIRQITWKQRQFFLLWYVQNYCRYKQNTEPAHKIKEPRMKQSSKFFSCRYLLHRVPFWYRQSLGFCILICPCVTLHFLSLPVFLPSFTLTYVFLMSNVCCFPDFSRLPGLFNFCICGLLFLSCSCIVLCGLWFVLSFVYLFGLFLKFPLPASAVCFCMFELWNLHSSSSFKLTLCLCTLLSLLCLAPFLNNLISRSDLWSYWSIHIPWIDPWMHSIVISHLEVYTK